MPLQGQSSPVQSSPVQSTEPQGKDTEHRALGPKGAVVGSLVFLALLFVFAGNGQKWLIGHASGIDAIAAEVPGPQPSAPSEASDLIGTLSKRESSNQHGCKSWSVAPWQVKKGKPPLPIPLCDETAATELTIDKYGRVERANVRDPGVIPILALQLAWQSLNQQRADQNALHDAARNVSQAVQTSAESVASAAAQAKAAAQSVGGAASSVSNSMVTLNGVANHLEGAAAYMAGSATKNAEAMKQIMNWVQATTQNLSFISREMSYMQKVKVNAGGEQSTTHLPDAGQILTTSTPCGLDQTGKYQIERDAQGQISVTPSCPTQSK